MKKFILGVGIGGIIAYLISPKPVRFPEHINNIFKRFVVRIHAGDKVYDRHFDFSQWHTKALVYVKRGNYEYAVASQEDLERMEIADDYIDSIVRIELVNGKLKSIHITAKGGYTKEYYFDGKLVAKYPDECYAVFKEIKVI